MMRPILNEEEYRQLRGSDSQLKNLALARQGNEQAKRNLQQFNYSCMPNEDGTLKGSTIPSNSVGMDIDHLSAEELKATIEKVLGVKDELGLLMMERSARGEGLHIVFRRHPEMTNEENLRWASDLLGVEFDKGAKDITRVFFATSDSEEDLIYLDEELFAAAPLQPTAPLPSPLRGKQNVSPAEGDAANKSNCSPLKGSGEGSGADLVYLGIPYSEIIKRWWEMYYRGQEPIQSNRNTLTFELAVNLRHICGFDRDLLDKVIPCYDGFPEAEKMACIDSALAEKRTQMPKRLKDVLDSLAPSTTDPSPLPYRGEQNVLSDEEMDINNGNRSPLRGAGRGLLPLGVRDSIDSVAPSLAMPVLTAICPAIGALASGVRLDVHGQMKNLNLIAYIAGDAGSSKGTIDPVIEAWTSEMKQQDKLYQQQEDEWRLRKRAAANQKQQPEEPKLPVRCLTLNNTVANLAQRLSNTQGLHGFSFTPEADTVAQKWRSALCDFSIMLRQSYDGSCYEREARSADAVNVHIDHLLWNVVMCGTPDALYRVINNYTDGFQSRVCVARTPDNTYQKLDEKPYVLRDRQRERIRQVAHLLPLMQGEVTLPKLEQRGRDWVENIRVECLENDDRVRARQRFRVCVTAQRMTCCLMLCRVCEQLIQKHGLSGAEQQLRQNPLLWKEMLLKAQTPTLLGMYDVLADSLLENNLYFFRDRIEAAYNSREYQGSTGARLIHGKNDTIYQRLDAHFTMEQALQQSRMSKGTDVSFNCVRMMLKNWRKQGLINVLDNNRYAKTSNTLPN